MKILHINTNGSSGGAAKACYRLHKALLKYEVESLIYVQKTNITNDKILGAKNNFFYHKINFLRSKIDSIPLIKYHKMDKVHWSNNFLNNPFIIHDIKEINPDIINLHWINGGFFSINQLNEIKKLDIPIVWTLHDSWAFTGGCHIPHYCMKFKTKCGNCPFLHSDKLYDLSRTNWLKKKSIYEKLNPIIVTPSNWLADCTKSSTLLGDKKIVVIPNSIDIDMFKLIPKNIAIKKLGLNENKKYLLFGAMGATTDKNKGFDLLLKSLKSLQNEDVELLIFGNNINLDIDLPINVRSFGVVEDNKILNFLYSAADITVVPSRSESFSLVSLESLFFNTPVVAFHIGGIPDIIDHKKNGYLAKPFDIKDFNNGILYFLNNDINKNNNFKIKEKFTPKAQARAYIKLYQSLQ